MCGYTPMVRGGYFRNQIHNIEHVCIRERLLDIEKELNDFKKPWPVGLLANRILSNGNRIYMWYNVFAIGKSMEREKRGSEGGLWVCLC